LCSQRSFLIEGAFGFDQIIFKAVDFVGELSYHIFAIFFFVRQGLFGFCKLGLQISSL